LELKNVTRNDAGTYNLIVSSNCPPDITSNPISLAVKFRTGILKEPVDTAVEVGRHLLLV